MKRRKYLLSVFIAVFVLLCFGTYFLYLKNVRIYEPLSIKLIGLSHEQCRQAEVYGVSPLNKKIPIGYVDSVNVWEYYYCFYSALYVALPDSVAEENPVIDIKIGEKGMYAPLNTFILKEEKQGRKIFLLSEKAYSNKSLFHMLASVLYWSVVRTILTCCGIILCVLFFTFLLFHILKFRRKLKTISGQKAYSGLSVTEKRILQFYFLIRTSLKCLVKYYLIVLRNILKTIRIIPVNTLLYLRKNLSVTTFAYLILSAISGITVLVLYHYNLEYRFMGYLLIVLGFLTLHIVAVSFAYFLNIKPALKNNITLLLLFIMIAFIMAELILRISGVATTYFEKNYSGRYSSLYEAKNMNRIYVHEKGKTSYYSHLEFNFKRTTNSLGLCDKEHPVIKGINEYRIISLGDSYTEGMGVHSDSTWLKFLERNISHCAAKLSFMNAGVSGSDPLYEYVLLKERLLVYQPDLVIVNINSTDIGDIVIRGGWERFRKDGSVKYKNPPSWEWLYSNSHIFRLLVHKLLGYNSFLLKNNEYTAQSEHAKELITHSLLMFQALADNNKFRLLVVFQPQFDDVMNQKYKDMGSIVYDSKLKRIECFDMLTYFLYQGRVNRDNAKELFWAVDGHYNTKGCRVYARGIEWKLTEMGILQTAQKSNKFVAEPEMGAK